MTVAGLSTGELSTDLGATLTHHATSYLSYMEGHGYGGNVILDALAKQFGVRVQIDSLTRHTRGRDRSGRYAHAHGASDSGALMLRLNHNGNHYVPADRSVRQQAAIPSNGDCWAASFVDAARERLSRRNGMDLTPHEKAQAEAIVRMGTHGIRGLVVQLLTESLATDGAFFGRALIDEYANRQR